MSDDELPGYTELMSYPVGQFFGYTHLRSPLVEVSARFEKLARELARTLPHNAETAAGLRKLLEAKDCAVRSMLVQQ